MSRILISGYYGFNNAGDDTVLYGIISSLKKQNPNIEIAVLSNKPEETEELFGIRAYNRWKMKQIVREIKKSDLLIMGGGSLLQDTTSPRSVIYYLGIVMLAKMLKKPVVFYAQGIGPIYQTFSEKLIKLVVNQVDVITVRDDQSAEDLRSYGVKKEPIYVTADPALTINATQVSLDEGKEILRNYNVDMTKPIVGFSVRDWKNEEKYKQELAKAADYFIEQGWNVVFLPMHYPADVSASLDVMAAMNKKNAVLVDQHVNFKDIMSIIGNMDYILGIRLHSIILAAVMNVPFVGVSYDPKIDRFLERLGMESGGHIKHLEYEKLRRTIEKGVTDLDESKNKLNANMQAVVEAAEKSSLLTLEALRKK